MNQSILFETFNPSLGGLCLLSKARSRSVSAENFTGEKGRGAMAADGTNAGAAAELGIGWKLSPSVIINQGENFTLCNIEGPGLIQHIFITPKGDWRFLILRMYWDGESDPSVETPLGDFFACGLSRYAQINSLAVCVNPGSALNCYWQMPFRKSCRITLENLNRQPVNIFYQIDYALTDIPDNAAYFHAQFRRKNPQPYKEVYVILDNIQGWGHYVGTYMLWGVKNSGWWGEGEVKFFIDGDDKFPTICGTGTEDYFCGSYNFENKETHRYQQFSTPYSGLAQITNPDGLYNSQQRFGMYRWHIPDPVRFEKDLRVTIHALGWRHDGKYLPLRDDISTVAFWYQTEPHMEFPGLPGREDLEII